MKKEPKPFEPGDVVLLNSGGPLMTVVSIDGVFVTCIWFGRHEQVTTKSFVAAALRYQTRRDR